MKRFTETGKWRDPWFHGLSHGSKLLFIYLIENCNNAGFYEENIPEACFHLGVTEIQYGNAIKALARAIKWASGWIWVRRFSRHQKNEELNADNPAHRQIIALLRDQLSRFAEVPEFQEYIAPFKGLIISPIGCPIGEGTGKGKGKGIGKEKEKEPTIRFQKPTQEEARAFAQEIGFPIDDCDSWYDHFESNGWKVGGKTAMRDWKASMRNAKRHPIRKSAPGKPEQKFTVV